MFGAFGNGPIQVGVLSVQGELIDRERLTLCFELEKSTSISTLLLLGIDAARRQFVREGKDLLERALDSARYARERLAAVVPELRVVPVEQLAAAPGVVAVDPTHPLIETWSAGLTGFQTDDWTRDERQVSFELVDHRRVMPLMTLREAFFAKTELVKPRDAVGRVSAELVTPYPPGIPAVVPGEVHTEATVDYLEQVVSAGGYVEGAADPALDRLRVVAAA
jgi:arginine/lysine/ornithine decarboxylase